MIAKKKYLFFSKKISGYTLTEILVVVAIIGILLLLAMPSFMPQVTKAKTMEAQIQLKHLHSLEKTFFFVNSKYSPEIKDLGFEQQTLVSQNGRANYSVEITAADNRQFKAKATSVTDFDGDGTYNVWEIDQDMNLKEVTPD
ncbi:MAG: type II secretion system protein [Bacteroidia bacterium]|nr:type II secretion system protein [Bacteroidia bacterium]